MCDELNFGPLILGKMSAISISLTMILVHCAHLYQHHQSPDNSILVSGELCVRKGWQYWRKTWTTDKVHSTHDLENNSLEIGIRKWKIQNRKQATCDMRHTTYQTEFSVYPTKMCIWNSVNKCLYFEKYHKVIQLTGSSFIKCEM